MKRIKLFCLPYAGGSAVMYNKWEKQLDPGIELIPVELAGRGRRIHEPLYKDVFHARDDVFSLLRSSIQTSPYALFGHSLGARLAYLLAQKIRQEGLPSPRHIFFSGKSAPDTKRPDEKIYHLMKEEEFRKEVYELGGTPPEFFEHPELLELFLPLLRNDFRLSEMDANNGKTQPLDVNITVLLGKADDLTAEQCDGWKFHTKKICHIHHFDGGHFFLDAARDRVLANINRILINGDDDE